MGLLAGCLAACLWGCLQGDKIVSAAYDPATDQFRFLTILRNIHSTDQMNDARTGQPVVNDQWLMAVYANRDHLIIPPVYIDIFGMAAFVRKSNSEYVRINLGDKGKLNVEKTKIDLDRIQIKPGKFFLEGPDRLAYYHQITVPGTVVDEALAVLTQELAKPDSVIGAIDHELNRRANGEPAMSWEDFDQRTIDSLLNRSTQKHPNNSGGSPLETQSLKMLQAQLAQGQMAFQRNGPEVWLTGELTSQDVKGALAFVDHFRAATNEQLKNPPTGPGHSMQQLHTFRDLLACVKIVATDPTHVKVSTDVVVALNTLGPEDLQNKPPSENEISEMRDVAHDVAGKTYCLKDTTFEQIIAAFDKNALASYPPKDSITPGAGLGDIAPATEPSH
jgi:hypothetical protein